MPFSTGPSAVRRTSTISDLAPPFGEIGDLRLQLSAVTSLPERGDADVADVRRDEHRPVTTTPAGFSRTSSTSCGSAALPRMTVSVDLRCRARRAAAACLRTPTCRASACRRSRGRSRRSAGRPSRPASRRARRSRAGSTDASARGRRRRPAAFRPPRPPRPASRSGYALSGSRPSARPCIAPSITLSTLTVFDVVVQDERDDVLEHPQVLIGLVAASVALPSSPPTTTNASTGVETRRTDRRVLSVMLESVLPRPWPERAATRVSAIVRDRPAYRRRAARSTRAGLPLGSRPEAPSGACASTRSPLWTDRRGKIAVERVASGRRDRR